MQEDRPLQCRNIGIKPTRKETDEIKCLNIIQQCIKKIKHYFTKVPPEVSILKNISSSSPLIAFI